MAFASPRHARGPSHYPFQWYWDSCFSAVVGRRLDPTRAPAEFESLLGAQHDDGLIGHTIFRDTPLNRRQRLTYNVLAYDALMTAGIQPPALPWAWRSRWGTRSGPGNRSPGGLAGRASRPGR